MNTVKYSLNYFDLQIWIKKSEFKIIIYKILFHYESNKNMDKITKWPGVKLPGIIKLITRLLN